VLIGARVKLLGRNIKRKGFRHVLGRLSATIISIVLGVPVYDTQCGAKFFRVTELTGSLFEEPFVSSWIFDVEILSRLIKAHRLGFSCSPEKTVWEAPLDQWVHKDGSKIEISDYFTALYELFKIRRKYFKSGD